MKRLRADIFQEPSSAWAGLSKAPKSDLFESSQEVSVPSIQEGSNLSTIGFARTCEWCEETILEKAVSCEFCDAGPFHDRCLCQHYPCVAKLRDSGYDRGPPSNTGTEAVGESTKDGEGKMPLASTSPKKSPKFVSLAEFSAGFQHMQHLKLPSCFQDDNEENEVEEEDEDSIRRAAELGEKHGRAMFEKFRDSQPTLKEYARGAVGKTEEACLDMKIFEEAWEAFQNDKIADSNKGPDESRRSWWPSRAELAKIDPFPLTKEKIDIMGTLLKWGQYRSAALYFSAAKKSHVDLGHAWSEQLDISIKTALRSCMRGVGPDKRCPSLDLMKVFEMKDIEPCKGGPRFPKETVIVFAHFACREVEASLRKRSDLSFEEGPGCGVLAFWLPVAKTDPKGNGALRRHGCTCHVEPKRCPCQSS